MNIALIRKYNVPGPRYTSYPTVPYWDKTGIDLSDWEQAVYNTYQKEKSYGISLYIHLPFCESLCTFCACHKHITKRHEVEDPYISAVIKEWKLYLQVIQEKPLLKEIHLGGGTPTFFSPDALSHLINTIKADCTVTTDHEFSFEGHPNNTTKEHLQALYDVGFRRVSFGVQDYDPRVQLAINRIQPFEHVVQVHNWSKDIGYTSISHDLVSGLPHQTLEGMLETIELTNTLRPDRLAFYSYAHVPWIKGVGSRGFDENDLPSNEAKRELYEEGKAALERNGYEEIGMDHFALKSDHLYTHFNEGKLHRNFMGYTTNNTRLMIGLGMSSISDSWTAFAQNVKTVKEYQELIEQGIIPIFRGHKLNKEDLYIRKHILEIMCHFKTKWHKDEENASYFEAINTRLEPFFQDDLIQQKEDWLIVNEAGKLFVRNICMAFDLKLNRAKPTTRLFSQTI